MILPDNSANTGRTSYTDNIYDENPGREITVWNEAGTDSKTYNVKLVWIVKSSNAQLASVKVDGTDVTIPSGGNATVSDALNSAVKLGAKNKFTMTVQAKNPLATVEIGSGDTIQNAEKNLQVRDSVTVTDSTELNGATSSLRLPLRITPFGATCTAQNSELSLTIINVLPPLPSRSRGAFLPSTLYKNNPLQFPQKVYNEPWTIFGRATGATVCGKSKTSYSAAFASDWPP